MRGQVIKYDNYKKANIPRDDFDFTMVDEVFGSLNPSVDYRYLKNKQVKNYFDRNTVYNFLGSLINIRNPTINNKIFAFF